MHTTGKILTGLSQKLQMPGDVLAGVPRIEMIGTRQVAMEPHKGLLEYGTEQISVQSALGAVRISGNSLKILAMNSHRITIGGTIKCVEWVEGVHE